MQVSEVGEKSCRVPVIAVQLCFAFSVSVPFPVIVILPVAVELEVPLAKAMPLDTAQLENS